LYRTLNINARALVRISQAVARNMIDAGIKGSIVNISSTISTVSDNNGTYMAINIMYIKPKPTYHTSYLGIVLLMF